MARPSLRVTDHGYAALMRRAKELEARPHVKVGVLAGDDPRPDGIGNVELATILHYGDSRHHVPPRPFFDVALRRFGAGWERLLRKILLSIAERKTKPEHGLGLLGEQAVADIKKAITSGAGIPPPNAPSTIKAKGSSRPLVDTGRLVGAISYEVKPGG